MAKKDIQVHLAHTTITDRRRAHINQPEKESTENI